MRFNPEATVDLLPDGQYEAVVKRAEEKVSKSGKDMIEIILTCYGGPRPIDVFDYLLGTDDFAWKVRHFCESAGIEWRSGELDAAQCVDKNVRVNLITKSQPGYADRNNVTDYLPRGVFSVTPLGREAQDDDIPF